jgi:DNA-binding IclR family transcriptional regulator
MDRRDFVATGKVLLAHLPADELERYFESAVPLEAATPKTNYGSAKIVERAYQDQEA